MSKLSENLKRLRTQRGITQKELACQLYRSLGTVSNYETGVHEPDYGTLLLLADFYGVSIDYLLGRSDCQCPDSFRNRTVSNGYTLGRLLCLLDTLPEERLHLLVDFLRLLEEAEGSGQDS